MIYLCSWRKLDGVEPLSANIVCDGTAITPDGLTDKGVPCLSEGEGTLYLKGIGPEWNIAEFIMARYPPFAD